MPLLQAGGRWNHAIYYSGSVPVTVRPGPVRPTKMSATELDVGNNTGERTVVGEACNKWVLEFDLHLPVDAARTAEFLS